jgi:hypothetical protein
MTNFKLDFETVSNRIEAPVLTSLNVTQFYCFIGKLFYFRMQQISFERISNKSHIISKQERHSNGKQFSFPIY